MRVSVIIASRLQVQQFSGADCLWLDRAIRSVWRQTTAAKNELEVIVGLDPGVALPTRLSNVLGAHAIRPGQSAALNAAVSAATGDLLAFLEDDDYWEPKRLEYGLRCLDKHDLVTCNQREVDADGSFVGINDYPTPCGWLLRMSTWKAVGLFDETFTFTDSEWLGRANAARIRRMHLVESGAQVRTGLFNVARHSAIAMTGERDPLVIRTVNPHGVMGTAQGDGPARLQHEAEVQRIIQKYGEMPW
jgi:hypothetical protein